MKKLVYIFLTIATILAFSSQTSAQTITENYHPSWENQTHGIAAHELALAGYPQFGQGQMYINPYIEDWKKDPNTIYDYYFPTPTEMRQYAQAATGSPVRVYMVDRNTSITFRAVSGSITGKDGLSPSEALSNLLLKIKRVPHYTTGGQILWFLYGQN